MLRICHSLIIRKSFKDTIGFEDMKPRAVASGRNTFMPISGCASDGRPAVFAGGTCAQIVQVESLVMKVPGRSQPRRSLGFTDVLFSRDASWFFVRLLDMELKISNTHSQIFRDKRLARISGLTQI